MCEHLYSPRGRKQCFFSIGELLNEKSEGRRLWKRGKPRKSRKDQDNGAVNSHPKLHSTLHKRFSQTLFVAVKTSLGLVQARTEGTGEKFNSSAFKCLIEAGFQATPTK